MKLFQINNYEGFIDGTCSCPSKHITKTNGKHILDPTKYTKWLLIKQNIAVDLYSIICRLLLPYVDTKNLFWYLSNSGEMPPIFQQIENPLA